MTDTASSVETKDTGGQSSTAPPTSTTSDTQSDSQNKDSASNHASSGSGASRGRARLRSDMANPLSAANLEKRGYHTFNVLGKDFHVDKRWKYLRELGQGAYGIVVLAQDTISGENVAIKLVTRVFDKKELAKRALREIVLLRHFNNHENITGLIDMDLLSPDFNEIYLFMEPMEADLHQIIRSGQALTNAHIQYFLYQLLRGCKYIHSANVIHRDLKPGNLLVNADCELKICDLGLARGFDRNTLPGHEEESVSHLTEYVATRWYRAPEIMLSFKRYGTGIDVWSIGCILGELLGGKPLFKGKDYVDQLNLILKTLGTPEEKIIKKIGSEKAQTYIRALPIRKRISFSEIFPEADPLAVDLLQNLLAFDPSDRITVAEALNHPYLESYHEIGDEPESLNISDKWRALEAIESDFEYRKAIWKEVYEFRLSVRSAAGVEGDEVALGEEWAAGPDISTVAVQVSQASPEDDANAIPAETNVLAGDPASEKHPSMSGARDEHLAATQNKEAPAGPLPDFVIATTLAEIEESKGTLPPHSVLPRTPLDPIPLAVPFPSLEETSASPLAMPRLHHRASSSSSASTLRPRTTTSAVDPIAAYAKRSNSLLFTPAQTHRRMYTEGIPQTDDAQEGKSAEDGAILMRSRAPSTSQGSPLHAPGGRLLRTLSTGGLSKLGNQSNPTALTQADLPPSALPTDFKPAYVDNSK